jgi:hypothetical protein
VASFAAAGGVVLLTKEIAMTNHCEYATQREAIREATKSAREWAADNQEPMTADVLLWSGDTLHITSTPDGKITHRVTAGWDRDGVLFMSRKTAAVAIY